MITSSFETLAAEHLPNIIRWEVINRAYVQGAEHLQVAWYGSGGPAHAAGDFFYSINRKVMTKEQHEHLIGHILAAADAEPNMVAHILDAARHHPMHLNPEIYRPVIAKLDLSTLRTIVAGTPVPKILAPLRSSGVPKIRLQSESKRIVDSLLNPSTDRGR